MLGTIRRVMMYTLGCARHVLTETGVAPEDVEV